MNGELPNGRAEGAGLRCSLQLDFASLAKSVSDLVFILSWFLAAFSFIVLFLSLIICPQYCQGFKMKNIKRSHCDELWACSFAIVAECPTYLRWMFTHYDIPTIRMAGVVNKVYNSESNWESRYLLLFFDGVKTGITHPHLELKAHDGVGGALGATLPTHRVATLPAVVLETGNTPGN